MVFGGMGRSGAEVSPSVGLGGGGLSGSFLFCSAAQCLVLEIFFLSVPVAVSGFPASPAPYPENTRELTTMSFLIA